MSLYPTYWAICSVLRSPPLLVSDAFAHLDRINIGFAKLQLSVAYALFGVPANLMLN